MTDKFGIHTYPTVLYFDPLPVIDMAKQEKGSYIPTEMIFGERITENSLMMFIRN